MSLMCDGQTFEPGSEQYEFMVQDRKVANANRNKVSYSFSGECGDRTPAQHSIEADSL